MTVFKPKKATGSHFYRYQSVAHLEWLEPIILQHLLYIPTVAQLNDPLRDHSKPASQGHFKTGQQ